jgi:hypothetical protein
MREGLPIDPGGRQANLGFKDLPRAVKMHEVAVGPPRHFFDGDAVHDSVVFSDDDRKRFLHGSQLTISLITTPACCRRSRRRLRPRLRRRRPPQRLRRRPARTLHPQTARRRRRVVH